MMHGQKNNRCLLLGNFYVKTGAKLSYAHPEYGPKHSYPSTMYVRKQWNCFSTMNPRFIDNRSVPPLCN
jgi:hypothetical protein